MRLATPQDVPAIMKACLAMLAYSPAFQMKFAEPVEAELGIRDAIHNERAFFFGGYFVMVDHGSDWYTSKRYLIEQLILKVAPDDKSWHVDEIVNQGLDNLATRFKCHAVAAGDTQIGRMTPLYHAAGYVTLGTQLMKESTYGIRSKSNGGPGPDRRHQG